MAIRRMPTSCLIPEATNTILECITLLAFLRQQLLGERVSVLRQMYIARFVYLVNLIAVCRLGNNSGRTPCPAS